MDQQGNTLELAKAQPYRSCHTTDTKKKIAHGRFNINKFKCVINFLFISCLKHTSSFCARSPTALFEAHKKWFNNFVQAK